METSDEEKQIHRKSDFCGAQAGRGWGAGSRDLPGARYQQRHLLPVEDEVRRRRAFGSSDVYLTGELTVYFEELSTMMFFGIRSIARKSQASVLVQNLLEVVAKNTDLGARPADIANKIVGLAWDRNPQWFGPNRPLPNKFILAACALSFGANAMAQAQNRNVELAMMICLAEVLKEIAMQREFNNLLLDSLDLSLLEMVTEHLAMSSE